MLLFRSELIYFQSDAERGPAPWPHKGGDDPRARPGTQVGDDFG